MFVLGVQWATIFFSDCNQLYVGGVVSLAPGESEGRARLRSTTVVRTPLSLLLGTGFSLPASHSLSNNYLARIQLRKPHSHSLAPILAPPPPLCFAFKSASYLPLNTFCPCHSIPFRTVHMLAEHSVVLSRWYVSAVCPVPEQNRRLARGRAQCCAMRQKVREARKEFTSCIRMHINRCIFLIFSSSFW
jgi:hypothetical protein